MAHLNPGRVVMKRYKLVEEIGIGGMASVWKAEDLLRQGEPVAIKFPRENADQDLINRFVREVAVHRSNPHPRIVTTLDTGTDDWGTPFLVMELLEGRTLYEEFLECEKRKPSEGSYPSVYAFQDTCLMGMQMAEVLEFLHGREIIHRDLKPENIMVVRGANGHPSYRLLDFGLARSECGNDRMTKDGLIVGSLFYMAPELVSALTEDGTGKAWEPGAHSDVFALATILFEAVTGIVPDKSGSVAESSSASESARSTPPHRILMKRMRIEDSPPDPALLVPGMDAELRELIMKGMEPKPWKRIRTASEMLERLRKIAARARRPKTSPPPPPLRSVPAAASVPPPVSSRAFPPPPRIPQSVRSASSETRSPLPGQGASRPPIPIRKISPPSIPPLSPMTPAPTPARMFPLEDREDVQNERSSEPVIHSALPQAPAPPTWKEGLGALRRFMTWQMAVGAASCILLTFGVTYALFNKPHAAEGNNGALPTKVEAMQAAERTATDAMLAATTGPHATDAPAVHSAEPATGPSESAAPPEASIISMDTADAPPDAAKLLKLGMLLAHGRAVECKHALVFFHQALEQEPDNPVLRKEIARCDRILGEPPAAGSYR